MPDFFPKSAKSRPIRQRRSKLYFEASSGRERSGSPLPKSRAKRGIPPLRYPFPSGGQLRFGMTVLNERQRQLAFLPATDYTVRDDSRSSGGFPEGNPAHRRPLISSARRRSSLH